jgi:hypothetical protein
MNEFVSAMSNTIQGVVYDCCHFTDVADEYGLRRRPDQTLIKIVTRQNRSPYIILWAIIMCIAFMIVVFIGMILSLSKTVQKHKYYYGSM